MVRTLMVVFGHLQSEALSLPAAGKFGFEPILLDLTGAGVDLFFVISGFVMVFASRRLFAERGAAAQFMTRRIARIVPLYWMTTTLFLLAVAIVPSALSSTPPTFEEIVKSYLFIPYFKDSLPMQPFYKLGWTLNYEMFFYLIFACCLAFPMRKSVVLVLIVLASLVVAGAWIEPKPGVFYFWTHPIILEFGFGAMLGSCGLKA